MRVEDSTVCSVGPLIGTPIVVGDPCLQECQHRVLLVDRRVLVRFPRTASVVGETGLEARVQEDELGGRGCRGLDELAVTAFDDPVRVDAHECVERLASAGRSTAICCGSQTIVSRSRCGRRSRDARAFAYVLLPEPEFPKT